MPHPYLWNPSFKKNSVEGSMSMYPSYRNQALVNHRLPKICRHNLIKYRFINIQYDLQLHVCSCNLSHNCLHSFVPVDLRTTFHRVNVI